jgi:DNA-nicking Smr family endonuclease
MAGVRPLEEPSVRVEHRPVTPRPPAPDRFAEDLEVLEELTDLVEGRGEFDIVDTDEYIEGRIRGLHPSILSKLRKGRFSIQAHLDLHGLTLVEAKEAVAEFIAEARALKHRCILLIHGRGLRSKDQIPVLKKKLGDILLTQPVKRHILAFTSARPVDGGAGASYVLLRAKP